MPGPASTFAFGCKCRQLARRPHSEKRHESTGRAIAASSSRRCRLCHIWRRARRLRRLACSGMKHTARRRVETRGLVCAGVCPCNSLAASRSRDGARRRHALPRALPPSLCRPHGRMLHVFPPRALCCARPPPTHLLPPCSLPSSSVLPWAAHHRRPPWTMPTLPDDRPRQRDGRMTGGDPERDSRPPPPTGPPRAASAVEIHASATTTRADSGESEIPSPCELPAIRACHSRDVGRPLVEKWPDTSSRAPTKMLPARTTPHLSRRKSRCAACEDARAESRGGRRRTGDFVENTDGIDKKSTLSDGVLGSTLR